MSSISKPEILVAGNAHVRYLLGGHNATGHEFTNFTTRGQQFGDTGATIWGLYNPESKTGAGAAIAEFVKNEACLSGKGWEKLRLILCLGEVDVRAHVLKHSNDVKTCADVVHEIVRRYENWLEENVEEHCMNYLCLMGTVPYSRAFFSTNHPSRHLMKYIPGLFNSALSNLCNERDWTYIDMYEKLVDFDGFLKDELSVDSTSIDDIHLDHRKTVEFIEPQIERYLANHR